MIDLWILLTNAATEVANDPLRKGYVKALAEAWVHADGENRKLLFTAWLKAVEDYHVVSGVELDSLV